MSFYSEFGGGDASGSGARNEQVETTVGEDNKEEDEEEGEDNGKEEEGNDETTSESDDYTYATICSPSLWSLFLLLF